MPPKPKFTRTQIVDAALEIVRARGIDALTTRAIGAQMGSSARPIFTMFSSMDELIACVRDAAMDRFTRFLQTPGAYTPVFKQYGMQMILFAQSEPKLFQLLLMHERADGTFDDMFCELGPIASASIDAIRRDYGLAPDDARALFEQMWIYSYGIAALCATKMCRFSAETLEQMLGRAFRAAMGLYLPHS